LPTVPITTLCRRVVLVFFSSRVRSFFCTHLLGYSPLSMPPSSAPSPRVWVLRYLPIPYTPPKREMSHLDPLAGSLNQTLPRISSFFPYPPPPFIPLFFYRFSVVALFSGIPFIPPFPPCMRILICIEMSLHSALAFQHSPATVSLYYREIRPGTPRNLLKKKF